MHVKSCVFCWKGGRTVKDELIRSQIHQAVDHHSEHLQSNPFLAQRIINQERTGEPVVKKRLSIGLVLVIVLMLIAVTALAVALLSPKEIVEQVAVPIAQENDKDWRIEMNFTPDELANFIRTCNENGIDLDENNAIMEAIRNGEGFNEREAIMAVCREAFGGNEGEWTLAEQRWFQEMMVSIGLAKEVTIELPGPDDLTEEEARNRMIAAIRAKYGEKLPLEDKTLFESSIAYFGEEAEDGTVWTLFISNRPGSDVRNEYRATLGRDGTVLDVSCTVYERPLTVDEVVDYRLTESEAAHLAAEEVRKQAQQDVPLEDPEKYHYYSWRSTSVPLTWYINFISHTSDWGFVSTSVDDATGDVTVLQADMDTVTADNILARYRADHGWYGEWDTTVWAEVTAQAAALPANTMEGRVVKATPWIAWRDGLLTREEAEERAFRQTGVRLGDVNCVCLIDAEPNPVWKFRILPWDESYQDSIVVEIDAVTGEMTDMDLYKSDHEDLEPSFHMLTLHRIWARMELEENGPLYLARLSVLKQFADMSFDEPEIYSLPIFDETYWIPEINTNTVHFRSQWSNVPDYQVTLDENGIPVEILKLDSSGTEELSEDLLPGGDGNG